MKLRAGAGSVLAECDRSDQVVSRSLSAGEGSGRESAAFLRLRKHNSRSRSLQPITHM